jgi:hypothetical protein
MPHTHGDLGYDWYPDPPVPSVEIDPGASMAVPLTHGEMRSTDAQPCMYVRVCSLEASNNFRVSLQAGAGDPTAVGSQSVGIFDQSGALGNHVADALAAVQPNGALLVRVFLYLAAPSPWSVVIANLDAATRNYVVVVAEEEPTSLVPELDPQAPILPTSALVGSSVVVKGAGFARPAADVATVTLGHDNAPITANTGASITFTVPPIKGGAYTLQVTTGLGSVQSPILFTVVEAPGVSTPHEP